MRCIYHATWCHIQEDHNLDICCHEQLKTHAVLKFSRIQLSHFALTLGNSPRWISIQQSTVPVDTGTVTTSNMSTTNGWKITVFSFRSVVAHDIFLAVSQIS